MLTIISVSYKSQSLLEMNYRLVTALNPNTPFHWIVVQNTPNYETKQDLSLNDPRFQVIVGPELSTSEKDSVYYRSIHHAKALNLAMESVNTDLVLILDPDCFLLMPNWIEHVIQHITKEKIVFWGTPYHPYSKMNYQGFPAAICMVINRQRLPEKNLRSLDFMPDIRGRFYQKSFFFALNHHCSYKYFKDFFFKAKRRAPLKLGDFFLLASEGLRRKCPRLFHESNRDTGYQIYKRFHSSLKFQTLQTFAKDKRSTLCRFIETALPSFLRTFPRNKELVTENSSEEFKEFEEDGCQFFWNGQLFAFHIQGTRYLEGGEHEFRDKERERLAFQKKVFQKLEEFIRPNFVCR